MTQSSNPRESDLRTQGGGPPIMGGSGRSGAPAPNRAQFPRWAMIFMAVVTLLALAIVVFSLILGVRAGQQQREFRRQQEIAIALQKAIDLRNEGLMEQSVDEYRHVLDLDPGNVAAGQGLEALLAAGGGAQPQPAALIPTATDPASVVAASSDQGDSSALLRPQAVLSTGGTPTIATPLPAVAIQSPAPLVTIAGGPTPAPAALPPATTTDLLARAQTAARAGRWQETVTLLEPLATQSATNPTIASLLFDGYLNLAAERDNEEQLEAALGYYDKALAIRPTVADVQTERTLISSYLDVLNAWELQWPIAITLLTEMYAIDPQYRDVKARLTEALPAYGEALAEAGDWCAAATQFQSATALETPDNALLTQLAQATSACQSGGTPVAGATDLLATPPVSGTGTPVATGESARLPSQASGAGPMAGRILYSATDSVDGRTRVLSQSVAGGATSVVIEDGAQPALRSDGLRFVYRNMRSDLGGLSAVDPATNVFFRITDYTEDILPSWDPTGGRVVFASNREGDRRWRIYAVWAEENGEVAMLSFGEAPAWNPVSDLIVHRGCDETGNGCGLWIMDGAGSNRRPITNVPGDNRPAWAPNGSAVVFMSDGRDGNTDIYRLDVSATGTPGAVVRLTNDSAVDAAPVVSPDGQWVAFMSNRDGAWKIYAVPMAGGATQLVATIKGDAGDWHMQSMLWVR